MTRLLSDKVSRSTSRYKEANEEYLRQVSRRLNLVGKDILSAALKEALTTAVNSTKQDSGNAAWHWSIGTLASPGRGMRKDPEVLYGMAPIGYRGDKGANSVEVTADTLKEGFAFIDHNVYRLRHVALTLFNPIDPDGAYGQRAFQNNITPETLTHDALEKARIAGSKAMNAARTFDWGSGTATFRGNKEL
jgi:hypothetical protein